MELSGLTALVAALCLLSSVSSGAASSSRWLVFPGSPQRGTQPSQLFRVSTAGAGLRQITEGSRAADEPAFSPDGRRVAFTRALAGIFVVDLDGGGLRRLTGDPDDHFPVWSPDGRRIAFLHPVRGGLRIRVIASEGRRGHTLRLGPEPIGRPSWMPNGKSLVIASHGSFFRVSATNGKVEQRLGPTWSTEDGTPSWTLSPDGRTIAIVARRPEPPGCSGLACDVFGLYVANVRSTRLRLLVDAGGFAGWTPDSRRVVYASANGLVVVRVADGATRTIPVGAQSDVLPEGDSPPAWQP